MAPADYEQFVRDNLQAVRLRIREACRRAGRDPESVLLVAVSKRHGPEAVQSAVAAGQMVFGENYVQEAAAKIPQVGTGTWHGIGPIQSNKARIAAEIFHCIQTVDRFDLARRLDRTAGELGRRLPVLLQVNVSGETTKHGVAPAEAAPLARQVAALDHLAVRGLMTMPPWDPDPEAGRPHFRRLAELARELATQGLLPRSFELSMGMSHDFEVAIEEGATIIRVGTAIFGPRH